MRKIKERLQKPIIPRKGKGERLIIKGPKILFLTFPYEMFYMSIFFSILFTVLLTPFAASLDKAFIFQPFSSDLISLLENASRSIYFEPVLIHFFTALFASWLLFKIGKTTHNNYSQKTIHALFISTLPWILLIFSYILTALVFKPAFSYQRPIDYIPENEPPLTYIFHSIMGVGESAPSGYVVRQMTLMMTILLLNKHESTPLKKKYLIYIVNILSVLSVIFVGLLRVCVGSHSLFDISFAIGCGAMIFWLIYIIPYSLYNQNGSTTTVCMVFLLFVGLFVFYAGNPNYWIVSTFITIVCLLLIDIVPEIIMSLLKKFDKDLK